MHKSHLWKLSCGIFLLWNHTDVVADDVIQPYVSASVARDSNLFRYSKDSGNDEVSDTISRIDAGVAVNYPINRQNLNLRVSVSRNQFQKAEFLNYDGYDWQSAWNWQVGNAWQGDLGYSGSQMLVSFTQTQADVRDLSTTQSVFANAGYKLHPDWRIHWGGRWSAVKFESPTNQLSTRDETSGVLGVDYISNANNSVGVQGQFIETRFPDGEARSTGNVDNGYSQADISSVADWEYGGNSHLRGRLGYTQRSYNQLSTRDFKGITGRLTYNWSITGKTSLSGSVWREVGAASDTISTFAVTKGSSLNVSWSPTSKIVIGSGVVYQSYDYRGDSGFALGVVDERKDDTSTASASLGYSPLQNIQLSLAGVIEQRDSTRMFVDYSYERITASIKVDF